MYGVDGQLFTTASSAIGGGGGGGDYVTTSTFNAYTGSVASPKASSASAASFGGQSYSASITFTTPYPNNSYAVTVTGEDIRMWSVLGKSASGFIIDSNSSVALSGPVYWIATPFNS